MAGRRAPTGLGSGGKSLWRAFDDTTLTEPQIAMLTEACRARDRLDRFDEVLRGDLDTWIYLVAGAEYETWDLHVNVADPLIKANQTAGVLQSLLVKLPAPAAKVVETGPVAPPLTALDELKAKREQNQGADVADSAAPVTTRARTAARRRNKD